MFRFWSPRKNWGTVINEVLNLPKHIDLMIRSSELPEIPSEFEERLGDSDGQLQDYGLALSDGRGIHVKVYDRYYKIHWDQKDPNIDPFGHLIYDAPQWLLIAAGVVDEVAFDGKYRKKLSRFLKDFFDF